MGGCCTKDSSTDTVRGKARRYERQPMAPRANNGHHRHGGHSGGHRGGGSRAPSNNGGGGRHKKHYVNVNTANEHELSVLSGLSRSQSRAIVEYRSTRGQYYHVNDLLYVPGISQHTLDSIRHDITIGEIIREPRNQGMCDSLGPSTLEWTGPHTRWHNYPPLSFSANPSTGTDKKPSSLRLATWNMQQFTESKVNDSSVLEIICLMILRYKLVN